jgi:hypothetical protein
MTDVADIRKREAIPSPSNLPDIDPFLSGEAPTILYHRDFPKVKIVSVCAVKHTGVFKDETATEGRIGYISADEYIERKVRAGFWVMSIAIVRHDQSTVVQEVQHEIITVLVKIEDP